MAKRSKKPAIDAAQKRLDFIDSLKEKGVVQYAENPDGSWQVAFAQLEDQGRQDQHIVGFQAAPFNPAAEAADAARKALLAGPISGVAPEVLAEVEAAAAKFEFESGLADPRLTALQKRIDAAKTDEEREHYQILLDKARREDIAYAHN